MKEMNAGAYRPSHRSLGEDPYILHLRHLFSLINSDHSLPFCWIEGANPGPVLNAAQTTHLGKAHWQCRVQDRRVHETPYHREPIQEGKELTVTPQTRASRCFACCSQCCKRSLDCNFIAAREPPTWNDLRASTPDEVPDARQRRVTETLDHNSGADYGRPISLHFFTGRCDPPVLPIRKRADVTEDEVDNLPAAFNLQLARLLRSQPRVHLEAPGTAGKDRSRCGLPMRASCGQPPERVHLSGWRSQSSPRSFPRNGEY